MNDAPNTSSNGTTTPVCCYCDAALSCACCGREQPFDVAQRPATRDALAQTILDEDYQHLDSYELADIVLKHWDVSWKASTHRGGEA